MTADEQNKLEAAQYSWSQMKGYRVLQSTEPNALSVGLADSPILPLAWIAESSRNGPTPRHRAATTS
ncbi:hypothetical protein [Nocardia sp. BMG51109]|uniref:hypothetical protein n=1 Tax=Nocardia sp. BMG51109 TaxID=1056816 RepID=UPI000464885D|nr:hypothetical protein [Nocardia sp. BMG51109]